ncbi:sulfatase-like hydrolase/transferase [Sphingobium algorifonticola]|uniref:Sulfatase n=1 Tax=Sphingobium algorifonticola TaxID=2008318 RepID=A0A437J473_9SPHN|nr:sulfatase-like hydrolase/transferase [Sphingobium algorifonticola]RVT39422.1 sulfatase [Sphingobium algorifonticola]
MVTRRGLIKAVAAGGLAANMPQLAKARAADSTLPNILWLVSEDHSPFLGCYGDPLARTPVIDALAKRGVLYSRAHANAPVCAPSRFGILTGCYPESVGPAQHMRAMANLPTELRTYPEYLRTLGYYCTNNDKTDYNCDVEPERIWNESSAKAHWRRRPEGAPFMAVFNYMTTHESRLFGPKPVDGAVRPEQVSIPPYLPDTPEIRTDYASYYNLIARMDGEVGARLGELEADGLTDDTIIFYYSDHGGVLPRSKRYCYEEGLRAALIVAFPPRWQHLSPVPMGSRVDTPVSLLDLPPTLLSLAGVPKPRQMHGAAFLGSQRAAPRSFTFGMRNRMDERYDFVRTACDGRYRYIRNYMPHRPWGAYSSFEWIAKGYQSLDTARIAGTLTPDQSRFFGRKPFEEFYDLERDPHQLVNLIDERPQTARLATFRKALDRHMLAIRDNGFAPEGDAGEGYAAARDKTLYPLARIMRVANVAARGDSRNAKRLAALLGNENAIIRFWAATGLVILGENADIAKPGLLRAVTNDSASAVRIACAEALCNLGDVETGLAELERAIATGQPLPRRLMALNAIDAIGSKAQPIVPAIKAIVDDDEDYVLRSARYLSAVLDGTYHPNLPTGRPRQAGPGGG